jgi:hypothetical protein
MKQTHRNYKTNQGAGESGRGGAPLLPTHARARKTADFLKIMIINPVKVLTNAKFRIIMPITVTQNAVKPRFIKGQKVIIKPVTENGTTQRQYNVNEYAGQVGEITRFFYISPRSEQIFFIYNVRVGKQVKKEIVVYEDELEPVLW